MYPMVGLGPEYNPPSGDDDAEAAEMNRLRGVAIVQAAETEAVLAEILRLLDPSDDRVRTAGALIAAVRRRLDAPAIDRWSWALAIIHKANECRNRIVHDTVQVGYSWREYATGDGGEHVPVIVVLGTNMYERDLRINLELQREATESAIEILHFLKHRDGESEEARYCRTCMDDSEDQQADGE